MPRTPRSYLDLRFEPACQRPYNPRPLLRHSVDRARGMTTGLALGIALMGVLVAMGGSSRSEAIPRDFTAQLSMGLLIFAAVAAETAVVAGVFLKKPISATVP
jgi:hypothetical protein